MRIVAGVPASPAASVNRRDDCGVLVWMCTTSTCSARSSRCSFQILLSPPSAGMSGPWRGDEHRDTGQGELLTEPLGRPPGVLGDDDDSPVPGRIEVREDLQLERLDAAELDVVVQVRDATRRRRARRSAPGASIGPHHLVEQVGELLGHDRPVEVGHGDPPALGADLPGGLAVGVEVLEGVDPLIGRAGADADLAVAQDVPVEPDRRDDATASRSPCTAAS